MSRRHRLLILDDDPHYRRQLSDGLSRRFEVVAVGSIDDARKQLDDGVFHALLSDLRLGGADSEDKEGLTLLAEIRLERPLMPIIMMTQYGDIRTAVDALRMGATDFLEKGSQRLPQLASTIDHAIEDALRTARREAAVSEVDAMERGRLISSEDGQMRDVLKGVSISSTDGYCSVLILGETGSGKEVVARSIHEQGWRREGPFVGVSLSALSPTLYESEIFGHDKGAFTGANETKIGYIERADGGILFLDEIGELTPEMQVKLLRFLEERVVYRVGSSKGRPVDVQLVAATNRDLKSMIAEGEFREDLFYRIRTVEVLVPPLRAHAEDIPVLAEHFLHLLRKQGRTSIKGFNSAAVAAMEKYAYPGNVRELRNIVERSILNAHHNGHWLVEKDDMPAEVLHPSGESIAAIARSGGPQDLNVERAAARAELRCLVLALERAAGKKSRARELLGYPNRHTMRRRIDRIRERYPELWSELPELQQFYGAPDDVDEG